MAATTVTDTKKLVSHAINNRLNTLMLGMCYLENIDDKEIQTIVRSLKMELRDLQDLVDQMKRNTR